MAAVTDPLANWPPPPDSSTPAIIPLLLPATSLLTGTPVRSLPPGTTSDESPDGIYDQTWIGTKPGDIFINVETWYNDPTPPDGPGYVVVAEAAPWDSMLVNASPATGPQTVWVGSRSGGVELSASTGLTTEQLIAVARSLTRRGTDVAGWTVTGLPTGITSFGDGWYNSPTREIRWFNGSVTTAQMTVAVGDDALYVAPLPSNAAWTTSLNDVNGAVAVVYHVGRIASVIWSPTPGVTVAIGIVGTTDKVLKIARSVRAVDETTWQDASREDVLPACDFYCQHDS